MKQLLILSIALCLAATAFSQDKNILAKIAYEDAEAAFSKGDYVASSNELKKVDSLLGKVTPKSQYLRVQVWNEAVEKFPGSVNFEGALAECRKYLALTKSYDLPEDKQLEVVRLLNQLQKDKAAFDEKQEQQKALDAKRAVVSRFVDSLYDAFKYKIGMTEADFLQNHPDVSRNLKRKVSGDNISYYIKTFNNRKWEEGSFSVKFAGGKSTAYDYLLKVNNGNAVAIKQFYSELISLIPATTPEEDKYDSGDGRIFLRALGPTKKYVCFMCRDSYVVIGFLDKITWLPTF